MNVSDVFNVLGTQVLTNIFEYLKDNVMQKTNLLRIRNYNYYLTLKISACNVNKVIHRTVHKMQMKLNSDNIKKQLKYLVSLVPVLVSKLQIK